MGSVGKAVAVSGVAVAVGPVLAGRLRCRRAAQHGHRRRHHRRVDAGLRPDRAAGPAGVLGPRVNRLRVPLPRFLRLHRGRRRRRRRRQGHGVLGLDRGARSCASPSASPARCSRCCWSPAPRSSRSSCRPARTSRDLPPTPARIGFEMLVDEFPGGDNDPIDRRALTWDGDQSRGRRSRRSARIALAAYVDESGALDGVTEVESVLDPPAGMEEATTTRCSPCRRPAARARPAAPRHLHRPIGSPTDTAKVRVFATQLPDSSEGRALVDESGPCRRPTARRC